MLGRLLALVVAAALTMGAFVPAGPAHGAFVAPDRAPARAALAALTTAAEQPQGASDAVRRLTGAAATLDDVSPGPATVAGWWRSLAAGARAALLTGAPAVVGNLEGVPYDVRDAANRAVLASVVQADEQVLGTGRGRGEGVLLAAQLTTLRQVQRALVAPANGPRRYLLTLDATTAGRAAIAVGDLSTARYVGFLVPGMYFSVRDQIVDWTATAADVQRTETAWLRHFRDGGQAAVVSWIGYRTPDVLNVVGLGLAQQGANRLADAVNGLQQARTGAKPFVSVLAHSYGATAALLALQAKAFSADAVAMVGAPGSPARSAAELAVPRGAVYVGEAALDGVATSGFFGSDPTATSYGAVQFRTAGGVDPITHVSLGAALGHNAYFAAGSESLRNIALVAVGRGADVTTGTGQLALGR